MHPHTKKGTAIYKLSLSWWKHGCSNPHANSNFFFQYCRISSLDIRGRNDISTLYRWTSISSEGALNNIKPAREIYSVCGKGNLLSIGCNKASSICHCSATSPPLLNLLTFFILRLYSEPAIQHLSIWTEAVWWCLKTHHRTWFHKTP